jgi:anti-sigma-K factor RskA
MDSERLDLSPLDPAADRLRWERSVRAILMRAQPELDRRAARTGVLGMLGHWAWPTLSAAAIAAVVSGAALALVRTEQPPSFIGGVVQALNLAEPVAAWLDEDRPPRTSDLVLLIEGDFQ